VDLKQRAVTSTAWYAGTRLATQVITWVVTVIVARLLSPSDYGLFAMALAVIAFLELFQEFGLGVAIIQRPNLTREQLNTVFWTVTASSSLLAGIAYVAAGFAAHFYHEPRLVPIIRLLGLTFLINALGMVPFNLLTKEINFRQRSLAEGIGAVSAAGVSLALAAMGGGVWALVVGNLTRVLVFNLGTVIACRWFPGLRTSFVGMREIFTFGLRVAGTSAVNTLSSAVNTSIVGRLLGGSNLGFYTMADSLGRSNPLHKISTAVVTQLSLPVFSKLQREDAELRYYFLKISRYLSLMAIPMQVGMALTAPDLVDVLLSSKWRPMVPVLQAFSIGGILSILPLPSFPLLTARGRVAIVFRYTVAFACVMALVTWVGSHFGLQGVAISWLLAFPLLRLIPLGMSLREVAIGTRDYFATIVDSVKATGVMAGVVAVVIHVLMPGGVPWQRLVAAILAGAATYVAVLLLTSRSLGPELREIARALLPGRREGGAA
jgi:O-antigen/teichoic acid export membrane protein